MKMKIIDRILLILYTLAIMAISIILLSASFRILSISMIQYWISAVYDNWRITTVVIMISLLFFVVSIRLLTSGIRRSKIKNTLLKITDIGAIRISLSTIDSLAQRSTRSFAGVRDVKSQIIPNHEGVHIYLKVSLMADVNIPQIATELQSGVKEYIEKLSGVFVKEVQIHIDNPAYTGKSVD